MSPPFNTTIPPELYLLLSVDIIGSTKLKDNSFEINKRISWMKFFYTFADNFKEIFDRKLKEEECNKSKLLKFLGDELIFYYKLQKIMHLDRILIAFDKAVCDYYSKNKRPEIGLKCTAWLVKTPVCNMIIKDESHKIIDFIGPSMDIGFRLSKYSNYFRFIISIDIAYILADIKSHLNIYYYGSENMKGVLKDEKYPVFYILSKHFDNFEQTDGIEKYIVSNNPVNLNDLNNYLTGYIDNHDSLFVPFVYNAESKKVIYSNYSKEYVEDYHKVVNEIYLKNLNLENEKDPKSKPKKDIKELEKQIEKL